MLTNRLFRSDRGFTLIEAMVVVGIMGIMAAVGYSSYSKMLQREKVSAAANQLMGHLKEAKMLTLEKHVSHAVDVTADGNYTIYRDTNNSCTNDNEPIVHRVVLAKDFVGVTIAGHTPFRFDTRGMPKNAAGGLADDNITLTQANKRQCRLNVTRLGKIDVMCQNL